MEVEEIVEKLSELGSNAAECKFSDEDKLSWQDTTKRLYDFIKDEEKKLGFPSSRKTLPRLHITNVDSEQIWQQLEIQNEALIPNYESKSALSESSLCVKVAKLSSEAALKDEEMDVTGMSDDEGVETGEDEPDIKTSDLGDELSEDLDDSISTTREDEQISGAEEGFSDLDADTFGDIAMENEESDEEEDDMEEKSKKGDRKSLSSQLQNISSKRFMKTTVDTKFLSLRESEWVADNDLLGGDDSEDGIDLMSEGEEGQSDEEAQNAMYNSFFDPPPSATQDETSLMENSDEEGEGDSDENYEFDDPSSEVKKTVVQSKFEKNMINQVELQESLEDKIYLGERPWTLKGEVRREDRPENSALEEPLEYNIAVRQKPIITEDTTKQIEKLLLSRVRTQAWDDVERRIKPAQNPFQFKEKLVLDQEKSKKSLAALYEEEFLRQNSQGTSSSGQILSSTDEKLEELPIHKEIRSEMEDIFSKLDALSNFHYTPIMKEPEIKVISNLPTITVEESTPTISSDATLLAPQEVVLPVRGEFKGSDEKTATDRGRERRAKKKHQRLRSQREERKLKGQMKVKDKNGLAMTDPCVKFIQKAFKKGQIQALEGAGPSVKSSTSFFKELQTSVSNLSKKRKSESQDNIVVKKKKKDFTIPSVSKLML